MSRYCKFGKHRSTSSPSEEIWRQFEMFSPRNRESDESAEMPESIFSTSLENTLY